MTKVYGFIVRWVGSRVKLAGFFCRCAQTTSWGVSPQGLQAPGVVVGQQEGLQVLIEFVGGLVVEALDGGFFAGTVYALNLAVGPGVCRLDEAVRHAVFSADLGKAVQAADAVALKAAVQRRPRQVRNDGLQRARAIVQCQPGVPAKGHGDGFLPGAKHRRHRFRPRARIQDAGALAPFGLMR